MAYQQDSRRDAVSPGGDARSVHRSDYRGSEAHRDEAGDGFRSERFGEDRQWENARDDSSSAAIERDIDRTRSRMDETVQTLADRLRPGSILSDVLDYFATDEGARTDTHQREKAKRVARRAGRGVWETVRANPMPSALIAGGIAWMFLRSNDDEDGHYTSRQRMARHSAEPMMYGGSYVDARTGQPYDLERYEQEPDRGHGGQTGSRIREYAEDAAEGARRAAGWVADKASAAAGAARRTAGDAAEAVGDTASDLTARGREAAGHYGEELSHRAHGMSDWSRHRAEEMARWSRRRARAGWAWSGERFDEGMRDYPLAMGVAALAAGVLAGLAIPRTRREDRLFGTYSHELKDRVGDVASEAWNRARDAAREEGLDPDSLKHQARDLAGRASEAASRVVESAVESAREVVGDVAETARSEARNLGDEAKDSGLTPQGLKQKAGYVASEAARGAKEEAEHQLEDADQQHGITDKAGGAGSSPSGSSGTGSTTAFTMPDQGKVGGS